MTWRLVALTVGLLCLAGAPETIRLTVDPKVSSAPTVLKVRVRLEAYPLDAALQLTIVSDGGYQAISVMPLPDPPIHNLPEKYYPIAESGEYDIYAELLHGDAVLARVIQRVVIL